MTAAIPGASSATPTIHERARPPPSANYPGARSAEGSSLSAAGPPQGARPLGEAARSDARGDPTSAAAPAASPLAWREIAIERIVRQTPRVISVFVQPPFAPHVAGQHADVRLTADDGYQAQRSYSIASAPGADTLELAIERLDDGEVSPYFHDAARAGDRFEIRGPIGGHFVWRGRDGGPLLLVGGGSGIAPLMSMVRHRAAMAPGVPALLVYSSRTWEDVIYRDELLAAARDPAFGLVLITTRDRPHRDGDYAHRLDRALVAEVLAKWGHAPKYAYVCGANGFVETATSALVAESVPAAVIRAERYGGA